MTPPRLPMISFPDMTSTTYRYSRMHIIGLVERYLSASGLAPDAAKVEVRTPHTGGRPGTIVDPRLHVNVFVFDKYDRPLYAKDVSPYGYTIRDAVNPQTGLPTYSAHVPVTGISNQYLPTMDHLHRDAILIRQEQSTHRLSTTRNALHAAQTRAQALRQQQDQVVNQLRHPAIHYQQRAQLNQELAQLNVLIFETDSEAQRLQADVRWLFDKRKDIDNVKRSLTQRFNSLQPPFISERRFRPISNGGPLTPPWQSMIPAGTTT